MPGISTLATESNIEEGLVLDSRDVVEKERYEEKIDYELATLIQKGKLVKPNDIKQLIQYYINTKQILHSHQTNIT